MDFISRYKEIKTEHPGAMLLFRVGDFYELYFEDAEQASKVLGLTLTTRGKNTDASVSMAGFPYHQLDAYLQKLIASGFRAAICDQVEDLTNPKGMVKRENTKTVVPAFKRNFAVYLPEDPNGPDIVAGEKCLDCVFVIIEVGKIGRKREFDIVHVNTGLVVNRTSRVLEEIRPMVQNFWDALTDKGRELYRDSADKSALVTNTSDAAKDVVRK